MQANHDPHIDLSNVIGAIPEHLKHRFHKEIQHAFSTNLCMYDKAYVTYTVIHFTSAESSHVALAIEDLKLELADGGWHLATRQTDPQFVEVYLASDASLIEPLNLSAFVEATGLDISEVRAPMPEAVMPHVPAKLHDHHVSGMKVLELAERAQQVLKAAFSEYVERFELVTTTVGGPHVLVKSKHGELFAVWPEHIETEVPSFRFAIIMTDNTASSELVLDGYSELVLHFADFLEPEKTRRYQLFRMLTESQRIAACCNVEYRLTDLVVTHRDGFTKSVKTISEAAGTTTLFNVEIVSENGTTNNFVATADDMENLLLSH